MHDDDLYGVQGIDTSVDLSKGIVVCPLLSFYFFIFLPFIFIFLVAPMALSISLICPLWDLLILSSLGSFLTLGATLYILQQYRRSFTLYKGTQIKKM